MYVISDEIYEKLIYDGFTHVSIASLGPEIKDLTIVVNGVSKSHAMTGWRIGYAAGPKDVITRHGEHPEPEHLEPRFHFAESGGRGAPRAPGLYPDHEHRVRQEKKIHGGASEQPMKGVSCLMPVGAFYAFPRVSSLYGKSANGKTIKNSSDLAAYLLEDANVALVSGDAFGADAYIRLSYATSMENIREGS